MSDTRAWRRWLPGGIGVIAVTALFTWLSLRDNYIGNLSDGAVYLLMADALSPWFEAPHDLGLWPFREFSFPPLYPLLLALGGGGSEHPQASYVVNAVLMTAMTVCVYAWAANVMRQRRTAVILAAVFALLPATLLTAMALHSEPLYLALVFGGLTLAASERATPRQQLLAAALFGFSALARSVGVAILMAAALHGAMRLRGAQRARFIVLLFAPLLCWSGLRVFIGAESSYADELLQPDFIATAAQLCDHLLANLALAPAALVAVFDPDGALPATLLVTVLALLAAVAGARRLFALEIDALYLVAYLGIIALWPFPQHLPRFLLVVVPLLLVYAWLGFAMITTGLRSIALRRLVGVGAVFSVLVVIAADSTHIIATVAAPIDAQVARYVRSPQWYRYDTTADARLAMQRIEDILESIQGVDEHLPADACVSSTITPYVLLYGHRRARPLAQSWSSEEKFFRELEACPYVFMMAATQWPSSGYPSLYPYSRVKDRLEVIEVKLWDRDASRGPVMTMLARLRADSGQDQARP